MTNLFASLEGQIIPPKFSWMNQPPQWNFSKEGLVVQAAPQTDFFRDPAGIGAKGSAHFLYTLQEGDFTLAAHVKAEMIDDYDAGCLMVMIDDEHWAKLCYEYSYKKPMIVSVVTQGVSDDCNSLAVPDTGVHLRITHFDDCFAFHYSLDGKWWEMVRYFRLPSSGPIKIGVVAQSPTGDGCKVEFGHLHFSPDPIREIRAGI